LIFGGRGKKNWGGFFFFFFSGDLKIFLGGGPEWGPETFEKKGNIFFLGRAPLFFSKKTLFFFKFVFFFFPPA